MPTTAGPQQQANAEVASPGSAALNLANTTDRTHVPVCEGYTRWAEVYDDDGNPLQALDSIALQEHLPQLLSDLSEQTSQKPQSETPLIIDLGCGTGRNTAAILRLILSSRAQVSASAERNCSFSCASGVRILGLDITPAMLSCARSRCQTILSEATAGSSTISLEFGVFDILAASPNRKSSSSQTAMSASEPVIPWGQADAIVSSLVAEHVPLSDFFSVCSALLKPGGILLATNMHPDMGAITGSGFTDPVTGEKVRVQGYVHSVADFAAKAAAESLRMISADIEERSVTQNLVQSYEGLRARGQKWLGVRIWMGALWKKESTAS